jgi:hypothetical protein
MLDDNLLVEFLKLAASFLAGGGTAVFGLWRSRRRRRQQSKLVAARQLRASLCQVISDAVEGKDARYDMRHLFDIATAFEKELVMALGRNTKTELTDLRDAVRSAIAVGESEIIITSDQKYRFVGSLRRLLTVLDIYIAREQVALGDLKA